MENEKRGKSYSLSSLLKGLAAGALSGLIATVVMDVFQIVCNKVLLSIEGSKREHAGMKSKQA